MRFHASPAQLQWRRIRRVIDEFDFGARILRFASTVYGQDAILGAWQEFRCRETEEDEGTLFEFGSDSIFAKLFISWFAHNWSPRSEGEGNINPALLELVPTEAFLECNAEIDALLYRYLESCTYAPLSLYEIKQCEPGYGVNCVDLIVGMSYEVLDEVSSQGLKSGDMVYARVVEIDGLALMEVIAPVVFPQALRKEVVSYRDVFFEGRAMPTEVGRARQLLEERALELRRAFWTLVYLVTGPKPTEVARH